eukprot:gene16799-18494_t
MSGGNNEEENTATGDMEKEDNENKDKRIIDLTIELQEELALTSSLTHLAAEKSSEIEYLKNKLGEQETRVHNLEDQIEEWTNQAEACDKLLEKKDCEIELLKKTLNIEKQQRRDLEDMMMENGKENLRERELLEEQIKELQGRLQKLKTEQNKDDNVKEDVEQVKIEGYSVNEVISEVDKSGIEEVVKTDVKEKQELDQEEKQGLEMEELMTDMFELIKQNEEYKEEIERLKTEHERMLESKRDVIYDLETTLEEKAAENERQRLDIRRMSSSIELAGMDINPERNEEAIRMKALEEDYIEECNFLSAELKAKTDADDAERDALVKENAMLSKKLEMEREQNAELNKQISDVSKLYDSCYMKYEDLEKSLNGRDSFDAINSSMDESIEQINDVIASSEVEKNDFKPSATEDFDSGNDNDGEPGHLKTKGDISEQESREDKPAEHASQASSLNRISKGTMPTISRMLIFVIITILSALAARYVMNVELVHVISALVVCNVIKMVIQGRKEAKEEKVPVNDSKLRRALQDAITRLDEDNFQRFSEVYDRFVTETYAMGSAKLPYDVHEDLGFIKAGKTSLEKELQGLRERNQATNQDYILMKTEIDILRTKRLKETDEKEKKIIALKNEIKDLECKISAQEGKEVSVKQFEEDSPPRSMTYIVKYLLIIACTCLCAFYVDDYAVLPFLTVLFITITAMMYKTDAALEQANKNAAGYEKTVKNLLSHVEASKSEENKIALELKEMESVIDKDYEIITKQRQAIERLERQLQRAIRKYQDKKRTASRFQWLQNHGFALVGNASFDTELEASRNESPEHSGVRAAQRDNERGSDSKGKRNAISSRSKNIATMTIIFFAGMISWYSGVSSNVNNDWGLVAYNYMSILIPICVVMFALAALSWLYRLYRRHQNEATKEQQDIGYNDEEMLNEQVDTLRGLLGTEREVVAKLEDEVKSCKGTSIHKVPASEIHAVIDKLIDLSKQNNELQVAADTTKDKYDNVKRTLEDILNREKYLSEEVAKLRSQKRELRDDLMKEQIKQIEMFEEVQKLRQSDGSEFASGGIFEIPQQQKYDEEIEYGSSYNDDEEINSTDQIKWKRKLTKKCSKNEDCREADTVDLMQAGSNDAGKNVDEIPDAHGTLYPANAAVTSDAIDAGNTTDAAEINRATDASGVIDAVTQSGIHVDATNEILKNEDGDVGGQLNTNSATDALNADLLRLQDELTQEKLRNFELSEKISILEMNRSLENDPAGSKQRSNVGKDAVPVSAEQRFKDGEVAREERYAALLKARDRQLQELTQIISFINDNRTKQQQVQELIEDKRQPKVIDFQTINKEKFTVDLHKLGNEILRLEDLCDGELKIFGMEATALEPQELVQYLTEQIGVFRYLISSDKAAATAKANAMQDKAEELARQLVSTNNDLEAEKLKRNHLIKEYEDEYERLEHRLTEAYDNMRKRLSEERALRGQIMKQYEGEIEDFQNKTEEILKDLRYQLKQERKEKEQAEHKAEMIMKKLKSLEGELEMIEARDKTEIDLEFLVAGKYYDINGDGEDRNTISEAKGQDIEKFKSAVDEETSKRTEKLKERIEQTMKDVVDYQNRLKEKEATIDILQKEEALLEMKIDLQEKRMKDMEYEIRSLNRESIEDCRFGDDGIIHNLSTKNGRGSWQNPAKTGLIEVSRSSAGFGNASDILDTQALPCSTQDLEGSWYAVDFGEEICVIPESYSLRHGWITGNACLRNWALEGSVDGNQWCTIKNHASDTTLNERYSVATWKVSKTHQPFRYFRIRMTGRNSSDSNELFLNGFEVQGKVIRS